MSASAIETRTRTLRWVLAHEPPVVFDEAARVFAELLREKTGGALQAELLRADEYAARRGQEFVGRRELVEAVQRGEVEMAHCYVAALGAFHDPLWAIELPFLFRDYAHAERVFEGPAAGRLFAGMEAVGLRGLAFAYSGGYRVVATRGRALRELADLRGLRLRTAGNPVPEALYAALGASAVAAPLEEIAGLVEQDAIDGCEITWVRFQALGLDRVFDTVNETGHSLFTTATVVNDAWFRGLTEAHQVALQEAAQAACRLERATAIEEEARTGAASPLTQVAMATPARAAFRVVGERIQEQFEERFGAELVEAIRSA